MQNSATRLGEMLLEAGLIDQFQLESALSMQRNLGGQIGSALVKLGYLPEETITEFLESQERNANIFMEDIVIPPEVMGLLPVERMFELTVVPLDLRKTATEKVLRVAMTDPDNLKLIDDLQFATRCKIIPVQASSDDINLAINNNLPEEEPDPAVTELTENPMNHGVVDFSDAGLEDPRLDRLLEILKEKGILSVLDVERIKFD